MNHHHLVIAFSVLGLGLVGCATPNTQNTVGRDKPTYTAAYIKDKRVETDPILSNQVHVVEIHQATVQDDLMKITVELVNGDSNPADFEYKFEWFDETGSPVDSPASSYTSQHIEPAENLSLTSIAPNGRCRDFRLKLQRSQRN
jgi:uncharacterized protein YcfL